MENDEHKVRTRIVNLIYQNQPVNFDELHTKLNNISEEDLNRQLGMLLSQKVITYEKIKDKILEIKILTLKQSIVSNYLSVETIIQNERNRIDELESSLNKLFMFFYLESSRDIKEMSNVLNTKITPFEKGIEKINNIKRSFETTQRESKKMIEQTRKENSEIVEEVKKESRNNLIKHTEIMGIFLTVFSIVGINISSLGIYKTINDFHDKIIMIVIIDVSLVLSMTALVLLIKFLLTNTKKKS